MGKQNETNMLSERDHRRLGRELDLFHFSDLVGAGLPLWTPKGTVVRNLLDDLVQNLRSEHGYAMVDIPHITKKDLFVRSGHWDKFGDELFRITSREGHEFAMKPMNCPFHTQIFARRPRSYREMPERMSNTTKCYRDEQTGELAGLSRTRAFTQDDAHVFCREGQVVDEALKIWDVVEKFYKKTGFGDLKIYLSLRDPETPEKYKGGDELWEHSERQLKEVIEKKGGDYTEDVGEAAFYGPKIDFKSHDSLGREWQVATIQMDRSLPEAFDLSCVNEKGEQERIVMIHAAIMGSIERFLAVFLEHTGGNFPYWLAPVQVKVLPISEAQKEYAREVCNALKGGGVRAELDESDETLGKKIRNAKLEKVPYYFVIGEEEMQNKNVMVESRDSGKIGSKTIDEFLKLQN